ncbi:MAG: EthD family reductase [Candidatus Rariloculaceae bacterium]
MIKVSVLYPNGSDVSFDVDYYCETHVPMVAELLGDALKGGQVDAGIAGGQEGVAAPYAAIGHLLFDSIENFQSSFGPNAERIMSDLPNFTKSEPVIQISEVRI